MQKLASVTSRIFCVRNLVSTVVSLTMASVKCLHVGCSKTQKRKNDQHHRGQKDSATTSSIVKDAPTECDAAVALPCEIECGCARHRLFWAFKEQRIIEARRLWSHTEQQKAIVQKVNQADLGTKEVKCGTCSRSPRCHRETTYAGKELTRGVATRREKDKFEDYVLKQQIVAQK